MDSSDIFDTASQEGEEEYEEELSAAEVPTCNLNVVGYQTWAMEMNPKSSSRNGRWTCIGVEFRCLLFKVLAKLEEAWINERNSPELLHPRMEMVEQSKMSQLITHVQRLTACLSS